MVIALGMMVVVLMLSLSVVIFGERGLRTGRDVRQAAQARAQAESGLEHARLWAKARAQEIVQGTYRSGEVLALLQGAGYRATVRYAGEAAGGKELTVESEGESGEGRHVAKALLRVTYETRSAFREGWFTGGTVSVTGQLKTYGARLHGDAGYRLNDASPEVCLPDPSGRVVCQDLKAVSPAVRNALITGSVLATRCDAPADTGLCTGSKPTSQVCPVWGNPPSVPDPTPCYDSLTGNMATVSTATRVPPPDLQALWRESLGLELQDNPYGALKPRACDYTVGSLSQLLSLLPSLPSSPRPRVCLTGDLNLNTSLVLSNVEVYVSGRVNQNSGTLTLNGARLVAGENMNLKGVRATESQLYTDGTLNFNQGGGGLDFSGSRVYGKTGINFDSPASFRDSRVFSGGSVNFNGNQKPLFSGDTLLAVNGSLIFNGSLKSEGGRSPLIVASGDVTFNGAYEDSLSASFIWTRGKVRFNGNTSYRGGIVSGGGVDVSPGGEGIVVHGGLDLYKTVLDNSLVPKYLAGGVEVASRR